MTICCKTENKQKRRFAGLIFAAVLLVLVILLENLSDCMPGRARRLQPTSQLFTVLKKGAVYSLVAVSMNLLNGFTGLFSLGQAGFMLLGAYTYAILTVPVAAKDQVYYLYGGSACAVFPGWTCSRAFWERRLRRRGWRWLACCWADSARGLVAALFACAHRPAGAAAEKRLSGHCHTGLCRNPPGDFPVADPWPHHQRRQYDQRFPHLLRFQHQQRRGAGDSAADTFVPFLVAIICIALIVLLINSSYGRAFKAIRDDEVAAEAMGINLFKHKMLSFVISSPSSPAWAARCSPCMLPTRRRRCSPPP